MKILIACEFSGIVREAFKSKGHDVWSCDLLPTEISGKHIQDDVLKHLNEGWDMMIGHPECTYMCNSGVRWLKDNPERHNKLKEATQFFYTLWNSGIPKICLENPIPHMYACLPEYTQIIQPWQHGHGETKATCLWLKGLPKLKTSNIVEGRKHRIHEMPPGKNRSHERSRTYTGIARAMSEQWG